MATPRYAFAALTAAAMLSVAGATTAAAAPYADEPEIETANPNPAVGGTVSVELSGFGSVERVVLELRSDPIILGEVLTDAGGEVSTTVALPAGVRCAHRIVAIGQNSGFVASTQIFIGSRRDCAGGHGSDGGNVGSGNTGSGNIGDNNTGDGNIGSGNSGDGNIGGNNTTDGNTSWGVTSHATTLSDDSPTEVLAVLLLGMAVTGGVGFLCTRRRHHP